MATAPNVIEVKAGEIAEELKRRGISCDEPVTLTIEPKQELIPGRSESRARIVAAGLCREDVPACKAQGFSDQFQAFAMA